MARGLKKQIPEVNISHPVPPDDLDDSARQAWTSLVNDLESIGRLHKTDAKLIELYARTMSLFIRVETQLATQDLVQDGGKGRSFINPLANLYPTLLAKIRQILADLGLTPKTRKDDGDEDELTAFMRKNGS